MSSNDDDDDESSRSSTSSSSSSSEDDVSSSTAAAAAMDTDDASTNPSPSSAAAMMRAGAADGGALASASNDFEGADESSSTSSSSEEEEEESSSSSSSSSSSDDDDDDDEDDGSTSGASALLAPSEGKRDGGTEDRAMDGGPNDEDDDDDGSGPVPPRQKRMKIKLSLRLPPTPAATEKVEDGKKRPHSPAAIGDENVAAKKMKVEKEDGGGDGETADMQVDDNSDSDDSDDDVAIGQLRKKTATAAVKKRKKKKKKREKKEAAVTQSPSREPGGAKLAASVSTKKEKANVSPGPVSREDDRARTTTPPPRPTKAGGSTTAAATFGMGTRRPIRIPPIPSPGLLLPGGFGGSSAIATGGNESSSAAAGAPTTTPSKAKRTPSQIFDSAMASAGYTLEQRTDHPHRGSSTRRTVGDMFDTLLMPKPSVDAVEDGIGGQDGGREDGDDAVNDDDGGVASAVGRGCCLIPEEFFRPSSIGKATVKSEAVGAAPVLGAVGKNDQSDGTVSNPNPADPAALGAVGEKEAASPSLSSSGKNDPSEGTVSKPNALDKDREKEKSDAPMDKQPPPPTESIKSMSIADRFLKAMSEILGSDINCYDGGPSSMMPLPGEGQDAPDQTMLPPKKRRKAKVIQAQLQQRQLRRQGGITPTRPRVRFVDMIPTSLTATYPDEYVERRREYVAKVTHREECILRAQRVTEAADLARDRYEEEKEAYDAKMRRLKEKEGGKEASAAAASDPDPGGGGEGVEATQSTSPVPEPPKEPPPPGSPVAVPPVPTPPETPPPTEEEEVEMRDRRHLVAHLDPAMFRPTMRYHRLLSNSIADTQYYGPNAPGLTGSTLGGANAGGGGGGGYSGVDSHGGPGSSREKSSRAGGGGGGGRESHNEGGGGGTSSSPPSTTKKAPKKKKKSSGAGEAAGDEGATATHGDLKLVMEGPDAEQMRKCLLRAAWRYATSGRGGDKTWVGCDGATYPDVSRAFAAHGGLRPCARCKSNKQGAYHCRLRRKHRDVDYDGGNSASILDQFRQKSSSLDDEEKVST